MKNTLLIGNRYINSRNSGYKFILVLIICIGWILFNDVSGFSLFSIVNRNVQELKTAYTYRYSGRLGTYDIFIKNITAKFNTSAEVKERKKQISEQYKSTWCVVPYQNGSVVEYRREVCIVDKSAKKFYTVWDGFNVNQVDTSSTVEPSLNSLAKFQIKIPANLPDAYSGQLFVIANNKFALSCEQQNVTSSLYEYLSVYGQHYLTPNYTMIFTGATDAANFVLAKEKYYFRITNHPSGEGVYIMSEIYGLCLRRFEKFNTIDKQFEIGFAECDTENDYQKFYWTGSNLVMSSSSKAYTLRFYAMEYGDSVGMVDFNTRSASSLVLMLVNDENTHKNPYIFKTADVLNHTATVEEFYKGKKVNDTDSSLQSELEGAVVPLTYSTGNRLSISFIMIYAVIMSVLQVI